MELDSSGISNALATEGQYGHAPREKADNCFRLMFENWNSLCIFTKRKKIQQVNDLITKYEVDCIAGCESQCDWRFATEEEKCENLFGVG